MCGPSHNNLFHPQIWGYTEKDFKWQTLQFICWSIHIEEVNVIKLIVSRLGSIGLTGACRLKKKGFTRLAPLVYKIILRLVLGTNKLEYWKLGGML